MIHPEWRTVINRPAVEAARAKFRAANREWLTGRLPGAAYKRAEVEFNAAVEEAISGGGTKADEFVAAWTGSLADPLDPTPSEEG